MPKIARLASLCVLRHKTVSKSLNSYFLLKKPRLKLQDWRCIKLYTCSCTVAAFWPLSLSTKQNYLLSTIKTLLLAVNTALRGPQMDALCSEVKTACLSRLRPKWLAAALWVFPTLKGSTVLTAEVLPLPGKAEAIF